MGTTQLGIALHVMVATMRRCNSNSADEDLQSHSILFLLHEKQIAKWMNYMAILMLFVANVVSYDDKPKKKKKKK